MVTKWKEGKDGRRTKDFNGKHYWMEHATRVDWSRNDNLILDISADRSGGNRGSETTSIQLDSRVFYSSREKEAKSLESHHN